MRLHRRTTVLVAVVALAATAILTGGPAGAAPSSSVSAAGVKVTVVSVSSTTSAAFLANLPPGWTEISWGSDAKAAPAASWHSSLAVGPVTLPYGVNSTLQATTHQMCTGAFGVQQTKAGFWRSSWSGYRRYGDDTYSQLTRDGGLITTYTVTCGGGGQGTYDYQLEAKGYTTAGGWSSSTATYGGSQSQRFACGT